MSKEQKIEELLTRGVSEIIDQKNLKYRLNKGERLTVKLGIDPTSPSIHIGRAVVLWKLRAFQELGHKVVFIVGDFTGLIGDTSDKEAERPMLSPDEIKHNLKTYFSQAFKILDKSKTETHYNSSWLKKMGFAEIGRLADLFSLHEFEARENISKRMKAGKRVSLREVLYPLMQGYDSVAVRADVELGGTDQRFNLLAGRVIQSNYNMMPQDILMTDLLEGLDGRKMSSSWGNVINITDEPSEMFGKVMSLRDELIERYFVLATRVPLTQVKKILKENKNPRDSKMALGVEIVSLYHGAQKAREAKDKFIAQFSKGENPEDVVTVKLKEGKYSVSELLVKYELAKSKSEARRLFEQKGIKIDGQLLESEELIKFKGVEILLQVGKRRFIKFQ